MFVKLPRQCSGQEIVDAFKTAANFQENPKCRFEAHDTETEVQFEPGSVKQTIRSMGVRVSPSWLVKKWIFFGHQLWKQGRNPEFWLVPLELSKKYEAVKINFTYRYRESDWDWDTFCGTDDPLNPRFEDIRPLFEKILAKFFSQLQNLNA